MWEIKIQIGNTEAAGLDFFFFIIVVAVADVVGDFIQTHSPSSYAKCNHADFKWPHTQIL